MVKARAVIYVSQPRVRDAETRRCLRHLDANDYQLAGIIVADPAGVSWREAFALVGDDLADVIVISDRSHMDRLIVPRVEAVGDRLPAVNAAQRRPRRIQES